MLVDYDFILSFEFLVIVERFSDLSYNVITYIAPNAFANISGINTLFVSQKHSLSITCFISKITATWGTFFTLGQRASRFEQLRASYA